LKRRIEVSQVRSVDLPPKLPTLSRAATGLPARPPPRAGHRAAATGRSAGGRAGGSRSPRSADRSWGAAGGTRYAGNLTLERPGADPYLLFGAMDPLDSETHEPVPRYEPLRGELDNLASTTSSVRLVLDNRRPEAARIRSTSARRPTLHVAAEIPGVKKEDITSRSRATRSRSPPR
jgi:hypothetical protein